MPARTHSFTPRPDAAQRTASAKLLLSELLSLRSQIHEAHLCELLNICFWKLTEAQAAHKHRTRFRTAAAEAAPRIDLRHDHVFERKKLVAALLAEPEKLDLIAENAIACTVTKDEHARLTKLSRQFPEDDGWARYRRANIRVIDAETGTFVGAV